jgi:hypothetical protein
LLPFVTTVQSCVWGRLLGDDMYRVVHVLPASILFASVQ